MIYGSEADPEMWTCVQRDRQKVHVTLEIAHAVEALLHKYRLLLNDITVAV